jgi:hypothetical protein
MNIPFNTVMIHQDPIGLRDLPLLEPDTDGWPAIRDALEQKQAPMSRWKAPTSWLAIAASLVFVVLIINRQTPMELPDASPAATQTSELASNDSMEDVNSLISLSQSLESQLKTLRDGSGSIPGSSALYIAELQDLVAQVDGELSQSPGSISLWGQRINLLLDLAQIYQHHWESEYGQMASL